MVVGNSNFDYSHRLLYKGQLKIHINSIRPVLIFLGQFHGHFIISLRHVFFKKIFPCNTLKRLWIFFKPNPTLLLFSFSKSVWVMPRPS